MYFTTYVLNEKYLNDILPYVPKENEQGKEVDITLYNVLQGLKNGNNKGQIIDFTNVYNPKSMITITAKKIWKGGPEKDHIAPVFELYADGEKVSSTPKIVPEKGTSNEFLYTWNVKAINEINDKPINYSVRESGVKNNSIVINNNIYNVTQKENTITNTLKEVNAKININKEFDNKVEKTPLLMARSLRSLPEFKVKVTDPYGNEEIISLKAGGPSKEYIAKYIGKYTIEELEANKYEVSFKGAKQEKGAKAEFEVTDGTEKQITVINKAAHSSLMKDITVSKKWNGGSEVMPSEVKVTLTGKAEGAEDEVRKLTLDKTQQWEKKVTVPVYAKNGEEYSYTIHEDNEKYGKVEINGNKYKVSYDQEKFTLTNIYEPELDKPDRVQKSDEHDKISGKSDDIDIKKPEAPNNILNKIDHMAYVIGYPDGTFKPEGNITRAEMATIFSRLLSNKIYLSEDYPIKFRDVNKNEWYEKHIGQLTSIGVISGYPDGSFKPGSKVTREEFAVVASRFIDEDKTSFGFSDTNNSWSKENIKKIKAKGLIKGYPDGNFRPKDFITRAEAVSIVNKMLERYADKEYIDNNINDIVSYKDLSNSHWAFYHIIEASNGHNYTRNEENNFE